MKAFMTALVAFLFATSLFGQGSVSSGIDSLTTVNGWKMVGRSDDVTVAYSAMTDTGNPFYWAQPSNHSQAFCVEGVSGSWVEYEKIFPEEYEMKKMFFFLTYAPASNGSGLGNIVIDLTFYNSQGDEFTILRPVVFLWVHAWSIWPINVDSVNVGKRFNRMRIKFELEFQAKGIVWFDNMGPSESGFEWSPIIDDFEDTTIVGVEDEPNIPTQFTLHQNYPNPFNPVTSIKYSVSSIQYVKLAVYDVLGREVEILVDEEKYPGEYAVMFDGSHLSSGTYFYRLETKSFTQTKKMVLIK